MNEFKIRKKSEIERIRIIRGIMCFTYIFGALTLICVSTGAALFTFKHVLLFSFCSIPLCVLYALTIEKFGSGLGALFMGWTPRGFSRREQLSADLERARHSKRQGRSREALHIIDSVLYKDANFPDALYLKGQILWEGLKKGEEASSCFKKVMGLLPDSEPLHRWASTYVHGIIKSKKR